VINFLTTLTHALIFLIVH